MAIKKIVVFFYIILSNLLIFSQNNTAVYFGSNIEDNISLCTEGNEVCCNHKDDEEKASSCCNECECCNFLPNYRTINLYSDNSKTTKEKDISEKNYFFRNQDNYKCLISKREIFSTHIYANYNYLSSHLLKSSNSYRCVWTC